MTITKVQYDWREANQREVADYEAGNLNPTPGLAYEETGHGLLIGIPYPFAEFSDAVIAAMDDTYTLMYIDYDDRLSPEQINAVFRGDTEQVWDSNEDWEWENRRHGIESALDDTLAKDVLTSWLREGRLMPDDFLDQWKWSDEYDTARFAMEDRDDSDVYRDLARQSGTVFVRVEIGQSFVFDGNVTEELVDEVLGGLTIPETPALRSLVEQILPECYHGGEHVPFLFGSVRVGDVYDLPWDEDAEVTLTGGSLLFEDCMNGAGYSEAPPVDYMDALTVTVKRSDLLTDDDQFGYSWDSVCGFVGGCYPISVEEHSLITIEE